MKKFIKAILRRIPGGPEALHRLQYFRSSRKAAGSGGGAKAIFTHFYEQNYWRNPESRSGAGSTARYTENIRAAIPELVAQLGVRRLLDAPCGDYNWFRLIERAPEVSYVGGDIVPAMIQANTEAYGNDNTRFLVLDITRDPLPAADLWLCRDVLFHLPIREIFLVLENFLRSDIRYLLTSTHPECRRNRDIPTGHFRLINLELPPFDLGPPQLRIDDWIEGYPVRQLCLWEKSVLAQRLAANPGLRAAAFRA